VNKQFFFRRALQTLASGLRLRGPLATDPTARLLHALVLSLAIWFAFWSILLIPLYPYRGTRLFLVVLQEVGPVAALLILRAGSLFWASISYLAGFLAFSIVGAVLSGGSQSTLLKYELMLPVLATWLLGMRGAIWTTVACIGSGLALTVAEMTGVKFAPSITTPLGQWLTQSQVILVGVVPVAQILERLRRESSERERQERALSESEQRFRNMANTAPVNILVLDTEARATFVNTTWLTFTGRTLEQELGDGWASSIHPDDLDQSSKNLRDAHRTRSQYQIEYRVRRSDGQYRSVLCEGIPRYEADGTLAGYIQSIVDITDIKQALASQKLESLGVLASGIAHDFNNLLGGILAGSELMLSDLSDPSRTRDGLENTKMIAVRASEIVRQLMAYAGEESVAFEEVDMAELVREMLQLMLLTVTKSAVLKIDVSASVAPVRGNAAELRQVVMNLITNASDALRGKGGTISVTIAQDHSLQGADFLRLEVRDSGCGMSEEIQSRIFDPFFSTKRAGRGMGLAAVRGIILSHGGTIKVHSAVGSGSCFEVLLPSVGKAQREPREVAISAPLNGVGNAPATVLIIDDEDTLRIPIATMLRRRGFSILESRDGAMGVDLFRTHVKEVDIVLLDMTLPGMSGDEILRELRKMRPGIKVVLSTAYGRDKALAGVSDPKSVYYLRKPYKIDELTAMLRRVSVDAEAGEGEH